MSGNTYIEFSFQKSLRKYQKHNDKKIKNQKCHINIHTNQCDHCLAKIYRNNSILSTDRKVNIQNSRRIYHILSRQKARQYSANKKNEEFCQQNSHSKSKIKSNQYSKQPSSEFSILERVNISDFKNKQISNFDEESIRDCRKQLFYAQQKQKNIIQKENRNLKMQNQLSIQKRLFEGQQKQQRQMKIQNYQNQNMLQNIFGARLKYKDLMNPKVIEQQEKSFSHIEIFQPLSQRKQIQEPKHQQKQTIEQQISCTFPVVSYAYFSSCSSLSSCQSLDYQNQLSCKISSNQQTNNQQSSKTLQQQSHPSPTQPINLASLKMLIIQSKQQLKKQYRKQHRQRILNTLTKYKKLQQSCSECENMSECLKKQLQFYQKEQRQDNYQIKFNGDSELIGQNGILNEENVGLYQSNQMTVDRRQVILAKDDQDCRAAQQLQHSKNYQQKCLMINEQSQIDIRQHDQTQQNKQFPFKRSQSSATQTQNLYLNSISRKYRKLNFQIQQNYQCLGRIKIYGLLGRQNESICLSIRRFSNSKNKTQQNMYGMDKQKIVNYLISQRPNLSRNKAELIHVVSELIEDKFSNKNKISQKET